MQLSIEVLSVLSNGANGHFAVNLRVVETTIDGEKFGPIETHGIEGLALTRLYGAQTSIDDAIQMWLSGVKSKMAANYVNHAKASIGLGSLIGKRLPIHTPPPPPPPPPAPPSAKK